MSWSSTSTSTSSGRWPDPSAGPTWNILPISNPVSAPCPDCAKCYRECPAGAIRDQAWTDREEDCIKCLVCRDVCPEGAIAYPLRSPGKGQPLEVDLRRGEGLIAGASGAAAAPAAQ